MEDSLELNSISIHQPVFKSSTIIQNETSCEVEILDSDIALLQNLLALPSTYDLRTVYVEVPLFASKQEVSNFCVSMLLLVENYDALKQISLCTNSSETLEEDIMENYRNDAFSLLTQVVYKMKPTVIVTDCLNCSNDIRQTSIRLLSTDNQKLLRSNISFSDLKFKRSITEIFPKLTRYGELIYRLINYQSGKIE